MGHSQVARALTLMPNGTRRIHHTAFVHVRQASMDNEVFVVSIFKALSFNRLFTGHLEALSVGPDWLSMYATLTQARLRLENPLDAERGKAIINCQL